MDRDINFILSLGMCWFGDTPCAHHWHGGTVDQEAGCSGCFHIFQVGKPYGTWNYFSLAVQDKRVRITLRALNFYHPLLRTEE